MYDDRSKLPITWYLASPSLLALIAQHNDQYNAKTMTKYNAKYNDQCNDLSMSGYKTIIIVKSLAKSLMFRALDESLVFGALENINAM